MNRAQPKPNHDLLCRPASQVRGHDASVSELLRTRPTCHWVQGNSWCNWVTAELFLADLTLLVLDVTFNEALPLMNVVRELFVREGNSTAAFVRCGRLLYGSAVVSGESIADVTG